MISYLRNDSVFFTSLFINTICILICLYHVMGYIGQTKIKQTLLGGKFSDAKEQENEDNFVCEEEHLFIFNNIKDYVSFCLNNIDKCNEILIFLFVLIMFIVSYYSISLKENIEYVDVVFYVSFSFFLMFMTIYNLYVQIYSNFILIFMYLSSLILFYLCHISNNMFNLSNLWIVLFLLIFKLLFLPFGILYCRKIFNYDIHLSVLLKYDRISIIVFIFCIIVVVYHMYYDVVEDCSVMIDYCVIFMILYNFISIVFLFFLELNDVVRDVLPIIMRYNLFIDTLLIFFILSYHIKLLYLLIFIIIAYNFNIIFFKYCYNDENNRLQYSIFYLGKIKFEKDDIYNVFVTILFALCYFCCLSKENLSAVNVVLCNIIFIIYVCLFSFLSYLYDENGILIKQDDISLIKKFNFYLFVIMICFTIFVFIVDWYDLCLPDFILYDNHYMKITINI